MGKVISDKKPKKKLKVAQKPKPKPKSETQITSWSISDGYKRLLAACAELHECPKLIQKIDIYRLAMTQMAAPVSIFQLHKCGRHNYFPLCHIVYRYLSICLDSNETSYIIYSLNCEVAQLHIVKLPLLKPAPFAKSPNGLPYAEQ